MNELVSSAYAKEAELRQKGSLSRSRQGSEGLYVDNKGRNDKRGSRNNNYNRGRSRGYERGRSKSRPKFGPKACWICGDETHWKRDCPQRKQDQSKASTSANVAMKLPTSIALTASTQAREDEWVLDSGCTFHITPRRDVLSQFEEFKGNNVLMGNNTYCMVKGQGLITIDNPDGTVVTLGQVRYIPDMARNLFSYGQLEQSGCKYVGAGFRVEFYKDNQRVLSGEYDQGLYYLQGKVRKVNMSETRSAVDTTSRWHSRLAHMSQSSMEILVRKGHLKKEEIKSLGFCESCAMGKSHKLSFPEAKHTTEGILDYVHSDLWGSPNVTPSLSGCKYFLTFIDGYSKRVWIYFLKTKDEAFQKFEEWKNLVENQTQKKLKCLRTDNGLEFYNSRFDKVCRDTGVKRHKTCPYTPQQNGVSERMNRTIMDKIRSMLHETGLGAEFLG